MKNSGVLIIATLLALPIALGCEEDVTAVLGTHRVFEIYGVLTPAADTQFVRVFPIGSRLEASRDPGIDAVVTSTDLETGERRVWRDSVLAFADGTYSYLFWSPFRPLGGRAYQLEIARSDGEHARAVVNVPELPVVLPAPTDSSLEWTVRLTGARARIHAVDVRIYLTYGECGGQETTLTIAADDEIRIDPSGIFFELELAQMYRMLETTLNRMGLFRSLFGILPNEILLRLAVTEPSWAPPGGLFDPEVLIEPGIMSNVDGGFGIVGGGYYVEVVLFSPWTHLGRLESSIPETAILAAGFRTQFPAWPGPCWTDDDPGR